MTSDLKSQATHKEYIYQNEERYIDSNTVVNRVGKVTNNQEYRPYLSILQSGARSDYREPVCKTENIETKKNVNRLSITKNRTVTTSTLDEGIYNDINEEETFEEICNVSSPQQRAAVQDEKKTCYGIYTAILKRNNKSLGRLCLFIFIPVSLILLGGVLYFVFTKLQSTNLTSEVKNVTSSNPVKSECHLQYQNPERLTRVKWHPADLLNSSNVYYSMRRVLNDKGSNRIWVIKRHVLTNNCYLLVLAFQYVQVLSTSTIDCLVKDMLPTTAGNISLLPTGVTLSTHQNTTRLILSNSSLADFTICGSFVYVLDYKKGQVLVYDEETMSSVRNVTLRVYINGHEKDKILMSNGIWYISCYGRHMAFMFDPIFGKMLKSLSSVEFPVLCDMDRYGNPLVIFQQYILIFESGNKPWRKLFISVERPIYAQLAFSKKKHHMWVLYKNGGLLQIFWMAKRKSSRTGK